MCTFLRSWPVFKFLRHQKSISWEHYPGGPAPTNVLTFITASFRRGPRGQAKGRRALVVFSHGQS